MKNKTDTYNSLQNNGTSQAERIKEFLIPENFNIDNKVLQDLIANTYDFARFMAYFNQENAIEGDWTCFFESEPLTFLAIIAGSDENLLEAAYQKIQRDYNNLPNIEKDEAREAKHALDLIENIRNLAKRIEHYYRLLPDTLPLKQEILSYIQKDSLTDTEQLAEKLHLLIGFHKEAYPRSLETPKDLNHVQYKYFFSERWGVINPQAFYKIPFQVGFRNNGFENLHELFQEFLKTYILIKTRAEYWFIQNLNTPQVREPHIALYFAFLKLFELVQEDLNNLTKEHLEFYYKEILHLKEREAIPDEAHLIIELAKNIASYKIDADTEFLDGKDAKKTDRIFKPVEDSVINKATVKYIKNSYLSGCWSGLFTNPDVSKKYSKQEEVPNEKAKSWRAFGDNKTLPYGEAGFAIASPQLILKEGKRNIELDIEFEEDEIYKEVDEAGNQINFIDLSQLGLLEMYLSTKEGWLKIPALTSNKSGTSSGFTLSREGDVLYFNIRLTPDLPAIEQSGEIRPVSEWPLIKLTINSGHENFLQAYEWLKTTTVQKFGITTRVFGIRENLIVQSDLGIFDGTEKFLPFGAIPERGDKFYLGSAEVFQKRLQSLTINFDWIDPVNFGGVTEADGEYYAGYFSSFTPPQLEVSLLTNAEFNRSDLKAINSIPIDELNTTVDGRITDETGNFPLEGVRVDLGLHVSTEEVLTAYTNYNGEFNFDTSDFTGESASLSVQYNNYQIIDFVNPEQTQTFNILLARFSILEPLVENDTVVPTIRLDDVNTFRDVRSQSFVELQSNMPTGFMRLKLTGGDFLHKEFPNVLTAHTISAASANIEDPASVTLPNPPYTPATNGISLDYNSQQTIAIGEDADGIDRFYFLLPFEGYKEISLVNPVDNGIPLVYPYPAFDRAEAKFAAGNLYIGLENVTPGANLSLLIQFLEGSEAEPELQAPDIHWSYLSKNNQWIPFAANQILSDSTFGLTRTGMVQLTIPNNIVNTTTLLEDEGLFYYLRAAAVEDDTAVPEKSVRALPEVTDVRAQALKVMFEDRQNSLEHLAEPLPEDNITKLKRSRSEVKKIEQPFPTFNGRLPEQGNEFYRRVSERLRHKDRAVTRWDYERIVLEKFPKIYRAKCLNHTKPGSELAPGNVMVAVIPDLKRRSGELTADPRFSEGDLREMEQFLRTRTNLFTAYTEEDEFGNLTQQFLFVENPVYETIRVKFEVKFRKGVDVNYHRFALDDEIKNFLAPWMKDRNAEIQFDKPLYRSKIVFFLEEIPYVDKIMNMDIEIDNVELPKDIERIIPSGLRTIFTTYLEEDKDAFTTDHGIEAVTADVETECI